MSAVFLKILNLSINATWLILAVMVLRLLMKRAPRWITCIMWAFVAVRLVCPFSLESALSLLPSGEVIPPDIATEREPVIYSGISVINQTVNPVITESFAPEPGASANPLQIVLAVAALVWVAGMILMLCYAIISFFLLKRKVRASIPVEDGIMICDEVKSPFILGVFRPVIYLPSSLSGQTYEMVKAHETAHIRRFDHWWKPLGFALLAVYWFNPACWIAYILLCRDIEEACDEKVIRDKGREYAAAYSEALLALSMPRRVIAACPLAFGENDVKTRVKGVLHYKKPAFWVILCALVGCVVMAVCFLTNPISENGDRDQAGTEGSQDETVLLQTESFFSEDENKDLKTWQAVAEHTEKQLEDMEGVETARITVTEDENNGMQVDVVLACAQTVQKIEDKKELQDSVEKTLTKMFPQGTEINVKTITMKDIEEILSSSEFYGVFNDVPRPTPINLDAMEGADDTQILFADKERIIFSDYYGLFVYSKSDRKVVTGLNLKSIGCSYTQGDNACEKLVSEDGGTVYLHPMTSGRMFVYQYGTERLTAEPLALDGLKLHTLPEGDEDYHYGDYDECTDGGRQMVTLFYHGGMIGGLCYADFEKGQSDVIQYYPLFAPNGLSGAVDFAPEDIHDLFSADIWLDGQLLHCEDKEVLSELERLLSGAVAEKNPSKCPFYTALYLTRRDGTVGMVFPATDDCFRYLSGHVCYKIADGTNEALWKLIRSFEAYHEPMYYYICGRDGDRLLLDDVEWITVGSERAKELGLTEDDMPNGFFVFNLEGTQVPTTVTDACTFTILDQEEGYSIPQVKEVDKDTFLKVLDERLAFYQEIEGGYFGPPYIIEMNEKGSIVSVTEQYVP